VEEEIYLDAYSASAPTYKSSNQEAGMAELKPLWGDRYDCKSADAQTLIKESRREKPQRDRISEPDQAWQYRGSFVR
jgi:hypothetical protein